MGAGVRDAFPPPMCVEIKKQCGGKSTTPRGEPPRTITQGRLRYTCQPCAIESITPMGNGAPRGWRGLSNVQCDEARAHRVVWWGLVGAVPMCPPVSPHKGASIVHPRAQCVYFWYGNAAACRPARAHSSSISP